MARVNGPLSNDGARNIARGLLEAQESERRRIALELHDEIGQLLTAIKLNLRAAERAQPGEPSSPVTESIRLIDEALHRVRNLSLDLRPTLLEDFGLVEATRWLVTRYAGGGRPRIHLLCGDVPARLPSHTEAAAFRVVQEALTNIVRHANAGRVWIEFAMTAQSFALRIRDDGIGFDVDACIARARRGGSLGLLGMQERIHLLGGRLTIQSQRCKGTEIIATIPLLTSADATQARPRSSHPSSSHRKRMARSR